ncbi:hypothetical protein BOTBODRAFT_37541 [Botryobasidium botryosum FD-172 SS1]|uniref:Anaphase-promoting complex subunit 4 WD40 domain-containing protein n=1 Tax=Botryobasidium botryosum (strain FD-172 SS1) TaxID=930990 RepID=A0A067MAJ8_BOTB1|nr:hypothetical protein BOTBODRAFT_37541 [Botryobasidium botryosum FD-172 SS1]
MSAFQDSQESFIDVYPTVTLVPTSHVGSSSPTEYISVDDTQSTYVLQLANLTSAYAASLSHPRHDLPLYDKHTLKHVHTFSGHANTVSQIRTVEVQGRKALVSCGKDGAIKFWDERIGSECTLQINAPNRRLLLSFDVAHDGYSIAAGTEFREDETPILFWDARQPALPSHSHTATHSDDVTAVHFHPTDSTLLLSASADGLICTSRATEKDEDEAGLHVGNWGCSIARVGWKEGGIWATSDMETFSLWNTELDLVRGYGDVRQPEIPSLWNTDYLIDASWSSSSTSPWNTSELTFWMGNNSGNVGIATVKEDSTWQLHHILSGGHEEVVRCVLWDAENSVVVTGGEDARIATWSGPAPETADAAMDEAMEGEEDESVVGKKRGFDSTTVGKRPEKWGKKRRHAKE